jgi:membrane protease subunit HflK
MTRAVVVLLSILLMLYLLSGIYSVGSDEMGVVTMFGHVLADRVPPGIHYSAPWPFTRIYKPKTTAIRRMSIGFKLMDQIQGIKPSRDESERLSGDSNVLTISLMVQYTVRDPADYLFKTEAPDFLVRKAGEALLCAMVGKLGVDDLLTVSKAEVEQNVRGGLQAFSDSVGAGLRIQSCSLQKVEPPQEVIESFNDVARAKANREKTINEARTYHSELIPRARAQAQQIIQTAEAAAAARLGQAEGDVARFEKILLEYRRNPEILRQRLFWETVQVILVGAQKYIIEEGDGKNQGTTLRVVTTTP